MTQPDDYLLEKYGINEVKLALDKSYMSVVRVFVILYSANQYFAELIFLMSAQTWKTETLHFRTMIGFL